MKTYKNDRNKWINFVDSSLTKYNIQESFIRDKNSHESVLNILTLEITKNKILNSSNKQLDFSYNSRKYWSIIIDSYERALAQFNLYCYKKGIVTNIGYFYIIGNRSFGDYYKLGCSKDAEGRLNNYRTSSPFRDFFLLKYLINENYRDVERNVISYLTDRMFNGEWIHMKEPKELFKECCAYLSTNYNINNRFCNIKNINPLFKKRFSFIENQLILMENL